MSDPKCPWCGESHPTDTIRVGEIEVTTCPRLGANEAVMFAPAHRVTSADFEALAKSSTPDLVAMVRLEDGSQVVAFQPHGLEVRAFGVDDLDVRGLPRWKP